MDIDYPLGLNVHGALLAMGIETPGADGEGFPESTLSDSVEEGMERIMANMGLDMENDSLKGTPARIAKMYEKEIFYGLNYKNFPKCTTVKNQMRYDEVVAIPRIGVKSMCEHHFLPFIGEATVGYIPYTKVLGLSKFERVVDFFSRRPQVQERLTEQVSLALRTILETEDVAVVIRADHYCMKLRGVKSANSYTVTSKMSGRFRSVDSLRAEFFALTK